AGYASPATVPAELQETSEQTGVKASHDSSGLHRSDWFASFWHCTSESGYSKRNSPSGLVKLFLFDGWRKGCCAFRTTEWKTIRTRPSSQHGAVHVIEHIIQPDKPARRRGNGQSGVDQC